MFCWLSDINSPIVKSIIGLDKTDALSALGKNDDVHLGGHALSLTSDEENDDDGDVAISDDDGIHAGGLNDDDSVQLGGLNDDDDGVNIGGLNDDVYI